MACSAINGATHTTLQGQNRLILAKLLGLLLPRGVEEESGLVEAAASTLSEADKRAAYQAAEKIAAIIRSTPSLSSVENLIHEFDVAGWVVTAENMQDNFREVERTVFCDGVNWGRIIAFLAFSVSFSAYVSSKGIKGGVQSVFGWTSRVLDRILSDFMSKKNGWVSIAMSCASITIRPRIVHACLHQRNNFTRLTFLTHADQLCPAVQSEVPL